MFLFKSKDPKKMEFGPMLTKLKKLIGMAEESQISLLEIKGWFGKIRIERRSRSARPPRRNVGGARPTYLKD